MVAIKTFVLFLKTLASHDGFSKTLGLLLPPYDISLKKPIKFSQMFKSHLTFTDLRDLRAFRGSPPQVFLYEGVL